MKHLVQEVGTGRTIINDVPTPLAGPGQVLIAVQASVISAGTERYVVDLAKKSLLGKARQRPEDVKRILQKIRGEGIGSTLKQLRAKLDEPMTLGYSTAGIVLACGWDVHEFKPGDRVAAAGPHAETIAAGRNLCALIPEGVSFEQAAYTSIASIALQGIRLARVSLGDRVLVIGLGLIGQICIALLKAQGCRVFGVDIDPAKLEIASSMGADAVGLGVPADQVKAFSSANGVDAVILTTATGDNGPIEFAAESARAKGRIVLVGTAGLNIPRPPFFKKELEFTVSHSLGPGRDEASYEEKGVDYPLSHVRWTAQRNMQTVLETIAAGRLPLERLTTHRFSIDRAPDAYDLISSGREPHFGIVIMYPAPEVNPVRKLALKAPAPATGSLGISLIGAGNFARLIMTPILAKASGVEMRGICTARGVNADHTGRKMRFSFATTDANEIWNDPGTNAVFIFTRHDLHATQVIDGLRAGKNVFVEKPLCIKPEELAAIARTVEELGSDCPILMVGFNRRFAPATQRVREFFADIVPLTIQYRFAPGYVPPDSWTQDMEVGGGRVVGEACHAVDTCSAIARSIPIRIFAESIAVPNELETTDDSILITIRHANGSISGISYQARGNKSLPAERVEVFGGGKSAIIDNWSETQLWKDGCRRFRGAPRKGHEEELRAFLDACRTGIWPIPWEDLYGTTWASLSAIQSLREGLPVDGFQRLFNIDTPR
jgi:predicted dehydrogenase